jgi:hypothetical protein
MALLKRAWFAICYVLFRPMSRLTKKSQGKNGGEDEYALQARRPLDREREEWIATAQRAAPELSKAAITFLTTVHVSGVFGTLAAISQDRQLAALPSIRYALVCFIFGTLAVGANLFLAWQYNLHHRGLRDLRENPRSVRTQLWSEIDLQLLRFQGQVMFVSAVLFFTGAILLTIAIFH